ncbi:MULTISPECIES: ribosomal protein S18-alanine N-acetyltransferase [Pseudoalteromonas]|uniref:ribosomal protein S18-alanine N-acetyltransferase n=1 Tax=Pseudoalteromonas TaxID=53246 RepID=UPI0007321B74|nr:MULTISPECIES: ribosomal protein S18-alanine N-acetyltransferase [Pseudoalteromonas]KTF17421.1 ribosomal-protein-alanine acetyltransferase [Pseudoalteromonas sp. H103]MCQ8889145.1 ribosomal protein S18-alanine N-acetyltransferase [Pseudoalteromonas carrageenovora]MDO6462615.1 ribosomal protein S18-alanine N-acetyltransferase [Pseudoalteromonas carrageenovora]MDO6546777.1 ribosomal protein S18-alanine N-acetyltransferase [Pseudoalteromonas carrageenovora]MDO6634716.1 ribosomal protein S18-ala
MITFKEVDESAIEQLMAIETACHSHPWTLKTMSSCMGGRYFNLAAFNKNTLVGFYIGEKAGPDFTLMDICVTPSEQGKGIAKQLLRQFIEYGEQQNAENLFLEVRESNTRAIALYERAGFIEMSVRKNYYPSDNPAKNGFEDAILMGMALSLGFS